MKMSPRISAVTRGAGLGSCTTGACGLRDSSRNGVVDCASAPAAATPSVSAGTSTLNNSETIVGLLRNIDCTRQNIRWHRLQPVRILLKYTPNSFKETLFLGRLRATRRRLRPARWHLPRRPHRSRRTSLPPAHGPLIGTRLVPRIPTGHLRCPSAVQLAHLQRLRTLHKILRSYLGTRRRRQLPRRRIDLRAHEPC